MKVKVLDARDVIALNTKIAKTIEAGYELQGVVTPILVDEKDNYYYTSAGKLNQTTKTIYYRFIATMVMI